MGNPQSDVPTVLVCLGNDYDQPAHAGQKLTRFTVRGLELKGRKISDWGVETCQELILEQDRADYSASVVNAGMRTADSTAQKLFL